MQSVVFLLPLFFLPLPSPTLRRGVITPAAAAVPAHCESGPYNPAVRVVPSASAQGTRRPEDIGTRYGYMDITERAVRARAPVRLSQAGSPSDENVDDEWLINQA